MTWVTVVFTVLRVTELLLQAYVNPDSTKMVLRTQQGATIILPCRVTKVNGKTKITANYDSLGVTIVSGHIVIGGKIFAKAHFTNGPKLIGAGPTEFGGEF